MMSERRFRDMEVHNTRIACNLCGSNGASVRCDKCQSMAFCLSCDDMYHRHPKRRYHLRKAVALEMPSKYFEGNQQNMMSSQNNSLNTAHPSKMPVPPPRRKKKGLTLSSIKETFASTGNKLRRFVSNEKLSVPPQNGNRYLNECLPKESPLIDKPMQTIRTQTLQNQRQVLPQTNTFGTLPTIKRHNSFPARLPEPEPTPPPLPPPRPKLPDESFYENYRKASLPAQHLPTNVRLNKVSSSIGDLSNEAIPGPLPERKNSTNTFDRRNFSLHDLRAKSSNPSMDDIPNMSGHQFYPQYLPNQLCYGYPVHPWTTGSLNNSVEDINLNDVEDYDSDASARQHLNRMKRASMKRCKSAFQMYQGMPPQMAPVPPFFYPYYYGHPCSGYTTPMHGCASPHPHMKPFNMSSRGSVDNMSTTSSSKEKSSSKPKYNRKHKSGPLDSREQFSDSGGRSVTSSSRQQSDFDDDEEDFFSVSDNDSSDKSEDESNCSGQWSCKFCTFLNDKKNTICDICSKTKKSKKTSNKTNGRMIRSKKASTAQNKLKASDHLNNSRKPGNDSDFDQKLINEQKEIEKELIRRLENERRIDRQNEIIQRKEEYVRRKSLGLPIEEDLIRQIRRDQELELLSDDLDIKSLKIESNDIILVNKSNEKNNEIKRTENQTNQQKCVEMKTIETMTETDSNPLSANNSADEKFAKSVVGQFEDNTSNVKNDKLIVDSKRETEAQNIQNQKTTFDSFSQINGTTHQTNGTVNHLDAQNVQNVCNSIAQNENQANISSFNDRTAQCSGTTATNGTPNQFGGQNQQNKSTPPTPTAQTVNNFDDRRPQYGESSYNSNRQMNGTSNQFGYQSQQNMSTPTAQPFNSFDDRRPYGPDSMYNQNSSQFQNPYNNFPLNAMMSPNLMSMNPMMSGFPMAPPMFSSNPLQNLYSSPYQQSLNGSQTGLDRFGYRSNSITSEQSFVNPAPQSQIGSRYSSCENLHSINQLNEKKSSNDSGLHLLQVLRDAEKNGFTSVDVEVALNFSPDKPIEWLEENWNNMCETVVTLTNNQIMQSVSKNRNKKLNELNLLNEEEAKEGLRSTKGNIWQTIDKCFKAKQSNTSKANNTVNSTVDQNKGSFSLNISGDGFGKDNLEAFEDIDSDASERRALDEKSIDEEVVMTTVTIHTSEVEQIETKADRKTMERLLTDWKIEKLSSDRLRQQEKERQKMRKLMELQKKISEFDTDDSEQDIEFHETLDDTQVSNELPPDQMDDPVLPEPVLSEEISEDKWLINSEFVEQNRVQDLPEKEDDVLDFEEYNSNNESDFSDDFDAIDARIEAKLRNNFNFVESEDLPKVEANNIEVIEDLANKFGESSKNGSQLVQDHLVLDLIEVQSDKNEGSETIEVVLDSKQEISKNEAKNIMKEIDRNVRRSLEELEEMELNVIKESKSIVQELPANHIYDESFGWARTEYECELCCEVYSINDLVAMISCTHYACRECLQKYYGVQIRERQQLIISCPFCDEPDINPDDDDKVFEYLGLMDLMIKHLVPSDVYELFQRKLRDRALMRDPNFLWCTQCSSGFIAPNPQAKTIMCPDCKNLTCTLCKKKWKKQHLDITCEQFAEWEKANDPSYADQQLDKHLKEFGIECPNCKFRYQLAKGGCMHFRCVQCSYDFCGGCARPFKMGNKCGISPYCEKMGLHSHHPRNCLFYLRDKDTDKLQSLLDKHQIKYKTKLDSDTKTSRCPVMEQKHGSYGLKDEACNRYVENAGLCRLHYKEYLGDLIWKNGIDPIHIFNVEELELVLKRENVKLPPKLSSNTPAVREVYQHTLIETIKDKVPLNLHH